MRSKKDEKEEDPSPKQQHTITTSTALFFSFFLLDFSLFFYDQSFRNGGISNSGQVVVTKKL